MERHFQAALVANVNKPQLRQGAPVANAGLRSVHLSAALTESGKSPAYAHKINITSSAAVTSKHEATPAFYQNVNVQAAQSPACDKHRKPSLGPHPYLTEHSWLNDTFSDIHGVALSFSPPHIWPITV